MKHNVIEALLPLLVPMSNLHLDAANTREGHDVEGIANSLVEFGQRTPLVVDAGGKILKGNGTFKAAQSLGWTHIAALRVEDDSVTAVRYSVADNLLGDKSRFNQDTLRQILDTLEEPESIPGADEDWLELVRGVDDIAEDYSDFEQELEDLDGYQETNVTITVPEMHKEKVTEWLANGESKTAPGLGRGVMRRCGLL